MLIKRLLVPLALLSGMFLLTVLSYRTHESAPPQWTHPRLYPDQIKLGPVRSWSMDPSKTDPVSGIRFYSQDTGTCAFIKRRSSQPGIFVCRRTQGPSISVQFFPILSLKPHLPANTEPLHPERVFLSPDGRSVVFGFGFHSEVGNYSLYLLDTSQRKLSRLTNYHIYSPNVEISPSGQYLSYIEGGNKENGTDYHYPPNDYNGPRILNVARLADGAIHEVINDDSVGDIGWIDAETITYSVKPSQPAASRPQTKYFTHNLRTGSTSSRLPLPPVERKPSEEVAPPFFSPTDNETFTLTRGIDAQGVYFNAWQLAPGGQTWNLITTKHYPSFIDPYEKAAVPMGAGIAAISPDSKDLYLQLFVPTGLSNPYSYYDGRNLMEALEIASGKTRTVLETGQISGLAWQPLPSGQ